jgi:charged multivesicular body protein 4
MLEKKERFLQKKSSAEVEKAKDYTKAKNKNGKCSVEKYCICL